MARLRHAAAHMASPLPPTQGMSCSFPLHDGTGKITALISWTGVARAVGWGSQGTCSPLAGMGQQDPTVNTGVRGSPHAVLCVTGGCVTPARISHSSGGDRADVKCHNTTCLQGLCGVSFYVSVHLSPQCSGHRKVGCRSGAGLMPTGGGGMDLPSPSVPGMMPGGVLAPPCLRGAAIETQPKIFAGAGGSCGSGWSPWPGCQHASSCRAPLRHVPPRRCAREPAPSLPGEQGRGRGRCPSC